MTLIWLGIALAALFGLHFLGKKLEHKLCDGDCECAFRPGHLEDKQH